MKTPLLSCAFALLSTVLLQADLVIVQTVEGGGIPGQSGEMTVKVKGNKMRIDVSKDASIVADLASGDMTTLVHRDKVYMQVSGATTMQMLKNADKMKEEKAQEVKLEPTGKSETIKGVETEIYTTNAAGQKATYWIAKSYPDSEKILEFYHKMQAAPFSKMARNAMPQPERFPGIPMKTEVEMGPGMKITTTLVSIKAEAVNETEFAIPSGYQSIAGLQAAPAPSSPASPAAPASTPAPAAPAPGQ